MKTIYISYLFDSRISLDAKGLLGVMIEEPTNRYSIASLAKYSYKDSIETIKAALKELVDNDYIAFDEQEDSYYVIKQITEVENGTK